MTRKGLFVTGTDTGVGKTVVTAALVRVLRAAGIDAVPMKPVQTGCAGSDDVGFALAASGVELSGEESGLVCPYRFEAPCSPHLAALQESRPVSVGLIAESLDLLLEGREMVVVEGAGGVLVPLGGGALMVDLMGALGLPVVLVARRGLGTINHTLLSLRELRRAGLEVRGVVFNETAPRENGCIERDNLETVARLGDVAVLGSLPFVPGLRGDDGPGGQLDACVEALSAAGGIIGEGV